MKKERALLVFLVLGLLCVSGVYAATCSSPNDIILRLSNSYNAHGETAAGSDYTDQICYSALFGDYTGSASRNLCNGNNEVLHLSSATNAHAEIPSASPPVYTNNICYGNLSCTSRQNACNSGETCVVTLSSTTNAHLAECSSPNAYPIKICCNVSSAAPLTPQPTAEFNVEKINISIDMPTEGQNYPENPIAVPPNTEILFDAFDTYKIGIRLSSVSGCSNKACCLAGNCPDKYPAGCSSPQADPTTCTSADTSACSSCLPVMNAPDLTKCTAADHSGCPDYSPLTFNWSISNSVSGTNTYLFGMRGPNCKAGEWGNCTNAAGTINPDLSANGEIRSIKFRYTIFSPSASDIGVYRYGMTLEVFGSYASLTRTFYLKLPGCSQADNREIYYVPDGNGGLKACSTLNPGSDSDCADACNKNTASPCCPAGYYCEGSTGSKKCVLHEDAINPQDIICSNFNDNETGCKSVPSWAADNGIKIENSAGCSGVFPANMSCPEVCKCGWNTNEKTCSIDCSIYNPSTGELFNGLCKRTDSLEGECVDGRQAINRVIQWTGIDTAPTACQPGTMVVYSPCGARVLLGFFGVTALVIVIALVIVYYFFSVRKHKRRN